MLAASTDTDAFPSASLLWFDCPPNSSSFAELCRTVEQSEGVKLAKLFAGLPTNFAATGDEALQNVVKMARGF